jgi:hypothetical protein
MKRELDGFFSHLQQRVVPASALQKTRFVSASLIFVPSLSWQIISFLKKNKKTAFKQAFLSIYTPRANNSGSGATAEEKRSFF